MVCLKYTHTKCVHTQGDKVRLLYNETDAVIQF